MSDKFKQSTSQQSTINQGTINQDTWHKNTDSESQPLIFTELRLLPRLFDGLLTCIAWGGFIWLLYLSLMSILGAQSGGETSLLGPTFGTILLYVLIALLNSVLLIIWAKYNQLRFAVERRTRSLALPDEQLTEHFGLTPKVLEQLKYAQIAVVHHNNDGTALKVDVRRDDIALAG